MGGGDGRGGEGRDGWNGGGWGGGVEGLHGPGSVGVIDTETNHRFGVAPESDQKSARLGNPDSRAVYGDAGPRFGLSDYQAALGHVPIKRNGAGNGAWGAQPGNEQPPHRRHAPYRQSNVPWRSSGEFFLGFVNTRKTSKLYTKDNTSLEYEEYSMDESVVEDFENIVSLASYTCGTSAAMICLIADEQLIVKTRFGLEKNCDYASIHYCREVVESGRLLIVENAELVGKEKNPLVSGETGFKFYAGTPLFGSTGKIHGSLDRKSVV